MWGRAAMVLGALLSIGCSVEMPLRSVGQACGGNGDCVSGEICAFGRCHAQCLVSGDCLAGVCASLRSAAVCLLAEERLCSVDVPCPNGLACGTDETCHTECVSARDCTEGQSCEDGLCVEPIEETPGDDASAGDDGSTGDDASARDDVSTGDDASAE